jgi:hypothetical protein
MELISTQRMTYEAWLHTWNLDDENDYDENENENDDEYSSSEEAGEGGEQQQQRQRKERRASRNDLKRVSRREVSLEDSEGKQCAICLAGFFEEEEDATTTTTTTVAGKDESKCRFVAELPCKHVYHEECIKSWLSRSRRCPTCRKSLREKRRGEAAKNGSEEGLLLRPREIRTARATRRGQAAEREDGRALREVDAVERERRAREEEEENRARMRNRMEALLTHEGMNDEIFESVIDHATRLLEAAAVTREEDEDTEGGREQEEEEEEEEEKEEESNMSRARVANQTGAGSLLVGTRGWSGYGSNTL